MARIQQTIETKKSIVEMRTYIDTKVLLRPDVGLVLSEHHWDGNVLHAKGRLGHGTITLEHGKVLVDIELTILGSAAKGTIEATLKKQFGQLNP